MNDTPRFRIFVVEDNEWYNRLLRHSLELNPDHEVFSFADGASLLMALGKKPDIVTLDYRLPDANGNDLLQRIIEESPSTAVIIVSEQEDIETAVSLLKAGARDYLEKTKDIRDRLLHSIDIIKKQRSLEQRVQELEEEVARKYDFSATMAGESEVLQQVFKLMTKATRTDINVIVTGETGTGKEMVSKAIHYHSAFARGPFVALNVAAIPRELIESELFGHEKGAFTGAIQGRTGRFEQAANGTLLLDEIGEMDLPLQAKLLRVLQEREFSRVGSNKLIPLKCRVIVATNRDLVDEVKQGRFREDLYYRLFGITINLPPLRERGNDILLLAEMFIGDFCRKQNMEAKKLSKEAKKKLMGYLYPGNVRELKSVVELAATLSEGPEISEADIHFPEIPLESRLFQENRTMREYEHLILDHFLHKYKDDIQLVSKTLDIGKSTIYRMLKEREDRAGTVS